MEQKPTPLRLQRRKLKAAKRVVREIVSLIDAYWNYSMFTQEKYTKPVSAEYYRAIVKKLQKERKEMQESNRLAYFERKKTWSNLRNTLQQESIAHWANQLNLFKRAEPTLKTFNVTLREHYATMPPRYMYAWNGESKETLNPYFVCQAVSKETLEYNLRGTWKPLIEEVKVPPSFHTRDLAPTITKISIPREAWSGYEERPTENDTYYDYLRQSDWNGAQGNN